MDENTYQELVNYLTKAEFPPEFTRPDKRTLTARARNLFVRAEKLYKRNKDSKEPTRVLKIMEVEVVLYNLHSDPTAGHFAFDATYERIKTRYFWHRMYRDIKDYVDACQVCQKFSGGRQTTPLHPLKTARPFDRLGIDLVEPLPLTK